MPRQRRFFVPAHPLHAILRGNNRSAIFRSTADYRIFLEFLFAARLEHGLAVHAYVLMTNHCHLLATPRDEDSLPKTLQSLGRRYVQHFNSAYERSGTLWEGRYRASLVHSDRYLLTCMRYIELNPVRAGMVARASDYVWSSHGWNACGAPDALVTPHPLYMALAATWPARRLAYSRLFLCATNEDELHAIRSATNRNWALGDAKFLNAAAAASRRPAAPAARGRRKHHDPENRV